MIKESEAIIPTNWGKFRMVAYTSLESDYSPHIVMVHPDINTNATVTIRIHSECLTGDLFQSQRCDCGSQLDKGMKVIADEKGILIYMRQEGRGIGIINKLKAYNKQDEGLDTIQANEALGLAIDGRTYEEVIAILKDLNVTKVKLLTNNPLKIAAIENSEIQLVKRQQHEIAPNKINAGYLKTKKESMGHLLNQV